MLDVHPKEIFSLPDHQKFVFRTMDELVERSRIKIRGYEVNTPDGVRTYKGCWVRDFTMLCESRIKAVNAEFIRQGLDLFFKHQGPHGEIPDWVPYQKIKPIVYHLFGKHHFLDNPLWLVRLMVLYLEQSKDFAYFKRHEEALLRGLQSENLLDKDDVLLRIDSDNIRDDWGFTDCIKKTGPVLFSNLLKADALRSFSKLYGTLGNTKRAEFYQEQMKQLLMEMDVLWDEQSSLYYSASGINRKLDVWGNAFAVYLGILSEERERKIAHSLFDNRDKFIWNGQVRHLFKGEFWEAFLPGVTRLINNPNTYQNGAYWGTPSGWVAYAFEQAENGAGKRLLDQLIRFYEKHGVYECTHPKRRFLRRSFYKKCEHYVASLALPMRLIKK